MKRGTTDGKAPRDKGHPGEKTNLLGYSENCSIRATSHEILEFRKRRLQGEALTIGGLPKETP